MDAGYGSLAKMLAMEGYALMVRKSIERIVTITRNIKG